MTIFYLLALLACFSATSYASRDWRIQRLNRFQQKYNNSAADIIFLLDTSGSLSHSSFKTEKEFVQSLLSHISIQSIGSRPAVITFGEHVKEDIDYIDYRGMDKNKCTFTTTFDLIRHRAGRATNMAGALRKAKEILDGAKHRHVKRANVNTVLLVLTDGFWNTGGNPSTIAAELRNRNEYDVEIFAIGIGSHMAEWYLKEIAGDTNNVIIAKDFAEFKSLATTIRGDQVEGLYQSVDDSVCNKKCDARAQCSCGTISGLYQCACKHGYYGDGNPGRCYKCNRGSYKAYPSPDPCKPCPANSITYQEGAIGIEFCKCKPGYIGRPVAGVPCEPVKCSKLPTTNFDHGVVSSCGQYYEETCTFTCNRNHHILNDVATSQKLKCEIDGTWNRAEPQCIASKCQMPTNPSKSVVTCTGNGVGDKCTFSCIKGYTLIGASERECQSDRQWSHALPHCQVITCPAVRRVENVNINPVSCLNSPSNYNEACTYSCKSGFDHDIGGQTRTCLADGTWSGDELACRDKTPPTIKCPENIFAETDLGLSSKEIDFAQPKVTDNSITGRDDITITQNPSNIKSPYEFPIGQTFITYDATDAAGNVASCIFRVEISDKEPPRFTNCPADIKETLQNPQQTSGVVSWGPIEYTDNSGTVKLKHQSHTSPHSFPIGPAHKIVYNIEDGSRNLATCEFFVKVETKGCPPREPPINGALPDCKFIPGYGHLCFPQCESPYSPAYNGYPPARYYICNPRGIWLANPPRAQNMWPDCTVKLKETGMKRGMQLYFTYSGSCHNEDAQKQIRDNVYKIMDVLIKKRTRGTQTCNNRVCDTKNLRIRCGKRQNVGDRKRRSAGLALTVDIDVEVLSNEDAKNQVTAVNELSKELKNGIRTDTEAQKLRYMKVDGGVIVLDDVEDVGDVEGVCKDGTVWADDNVYQDGARNNVVNKTCVSCVGGNYFDTTIRKCKKCPKGTYTESSGNLGCEACPHGKTTLSDGTSNSTHCKAPCLPGTYSSTGLANCKDCPKGQYSSDVYATGCTSCPGSTTTLGKGATGIKQCGMTCPKGTFSKTGVEPCKPCAIGFYQPTTGGTQCFQCSGSLSTHAVGTIQDSECQAINNCASKPCQNGGVCSNEFNGFSCSCKSGYSGKKCQVEKNECAENPCYGEAKCVDKVGSFVCVCPANYHGKFCNDKVSRCQAKTCENGGSCLDAPEGIECTCKTGFQGKFCERIIDECAASPCLNGAVCLDHVRGFSCVCKPGFTGPRCSENIDDCAQNNQCLNGGSCVDLVNGHSCSCMAGYSGDRCEINNDDCVSNPCRNGAQCVDQVNGYKCKCEPTFYGANCDQRRTNFDFSLEFNREVQGFAETTLHKNLQEFTISFWIDASTDIIEAGTVLSYAIETDAGVMDNALVLRDVNHLILVVMGDEVETNITANEKDWHHIAVTWSGKTGQYSAYLNGFKITSGSRLQQGKVIPGNGVFILGQEQDEVGRNFSASEALTGKLSQFNVHDYVMSDAEVAELSSYRCDHVAGNAIAWVDFIGKTSEDIKKTSTFCSGCKFQNGDGTGGTEINTGKAVNNPAECVNICVLMKDKDPVINGATLSTTGSGTCYCEKGMTGRNNNGNGKKWQSCMMNLAKNTKFSSYTGNTSPCGGNGQAQCIISAGNAFSTINDLNLIGADCTGSQGFTCDDSKQNNTKCPTSVNVRYECPYKKELTCPFKQGFGTGGHQFIGFKSRSECVKACAARKATDNTINGVTVPLKSFLKHCFCNKNMKGISASNHYLTCTLQYPVSCQPNSCNGNGNCVSTLRGFVCQCNDGYKGKTCNEAVPCAPINYFKNGRVSQSGNTYAFSCNAGFKLTGQRSVQCVNGQLNAALPRCDDVDECKTGNGNCMHKCVNTIGSFECVCYNGYRKSGTVCVDNDECGTNMNNCQEKCHNGRGAYTCGCRNYYRLAADRVSCEDIDECATKTHNCQQGCLNIAKGYKCTCEPGFTLASDQSTCNSVRCPSLRAPSNGRVSQGYGTYKTLVTYTCNKHYRLNGADERICDADGVWSGAEPKCDSVQCPDLSSPRNGQASRTGNGEDRVYSFACLRNHLMIGDNKRKCQKDGTWSGVQPRCIPYHCQPISAPTHGAVIGSSYVLDATIIIKCDEGYMLQDKNNNYKTCLSSGAWSGNAPRCVVVNCGAPNRPTNGTVVGSSYNYKDQVTYKCNSGSGLSGPPVRTCGIDGKWDPQEPTCLWNSCGYPGAPRNGDVMGSDYSFGKSVTYKCKNGYRLVGNNGTKCSLSGIWSGSVPVCEEISCGNPGVPRNGEVAGNKYNINATLTFDCKPGFAIRGSRTIKCEVNARWSNALPTCQANICGSAKLVGPKGVIASPNFPNSYGNNEYCRWRVVMPTSKQARLTVPVLKTAEPEDRLELYDGKNGAILTILTGAILNPISITSPSNEMDIKFVTNNQNVADGFKGDYDGAICGGQISSIGSVIQTPNYPANYPNGITCTWQIVVPGERLLLDFEEFNTANSYDTLEVYNSVNSLDGGTKIGSHYGNRGSFLEVKSYEVMYLRFKTDPYRSASGFKATLLRNKDII